MVKILDGVILAQKIRSKIALDVIRIKQKYNIIPGLAVVIVGDNPASIIYVNNKIRACAKVGIYSKIFRYSNLVSLSELIILIHCLNNDSTFHGILIQLPLPLHINEDIIVESLSPTKDVDGVHPLNIGKLLRGYPHFISCTPAGIQYILINNGYDPAGQHVVICNRSNIVGKPLSALLGQRSLGGNATVTICHQETTNLIDFTKTADILVTAIGSPKIITANMVKNNAIVIDVGITRIEDLTNKNGYHVEGDVDFIPVSQKVEAITPVPGGIGPMTVSMLLVNTLAAVYLSVSNEEWLTFIKDWYIMYK